MVKKAKKVKKAANVVKKASSPKAKKATAKAGAPQAGALQAKPAALAPNIATADNPPRGTCTITGPLGTKTTEDNYTEARCKAAANAVAGTYLFTPYK